MTNHTIEMMHAEQNAHEHWKLISRHMHAAADAMLESHLSGYKRRVHHHMLAALRAAWKLQAELLDLLAGELNDQP